MVAAGLALLPLAFIIQQVGQVGWSDARRLLWRPRVGELLTNTLQLTITVTVLCVLVGLAAAWCVECTDVPFRRVLAVLLALPIAVPEYVNGFGWVSIVPGMHGFWAAVLVMTLSHYPLVYLPAAAMLRVGDPALEEASRLLGRGPWSTFLHVTLPRLRLALLGGGLVIALHLLAEYGGFAIMRYRTFTTEIYNTYKLGFDPASASLLSLVLVALCVLVLGGEQWLRGRGGALRGGSTARRRRRVRLGRRRWPVMAGLAALVGLALGGADRRAGATGSSWAARPRCPRPRSPPRPRRRSSTGWRRRAWPARSPCRWPSWRCAAAGRWRRSSSGRSTCRGRCRAWSWASRWSTSRSATPSRSTRRRC